LRILHVINTLGTGGAETLLYNLVARPSATEHEVITLGGRDRYSEPLEHHGISVHHLEMSPGRSFGKGLGRLNRIIRKSGADVVQTWMYRSNVLGGLCARVAGIPVVWGIHCSSLDALGPGSRLLVYLSGALARWVPDCIVNCSVRSAELHRRLGYPVRGARVIHNGYDPVVFSPDESRRAATREALGVSAGTFLIGSIGRWHRQKGIAILLEAVRVLNNRNVPVSCLLVGRGFDQDNGELTALIARNDGRNQIQAIGERSDIPDIARSLDLHVLASIGSEAFPNVVGETMLCGTPNVVTDVGDSARMVGNTGWVVPPRDPKLLAAAIEQAWHEWTNEPERWENRRAAARRRIADNFTLDRMAAEYEQAWKMLAAAT
jgi:glycosyltransferase involved in cell wall biosynthesis